MDEDARESAEPKRSAMYMTRAPIVFFSILLAVNFTGCTVRDDAFANAGPTTVPTTTDPVAIKSINTCLEWIPNNLDLGGESINNYHVSVSQLSGAINFVQFAHKTHMADAVLEGVGIETVLGGFPYYFSVDVSADGQHVLNHYASPE